VYQIGAIDLPSLLQKVKGNCAPDDTPAYRDWRRQLDSLNADADAFTKGNTQNTRTRKYYFMRSEIAKHMAREPITACMIAAKKAGRAISDFQAINEIRQPLLTLANEWHDRATKSERMEYIKVGLVVVTVATAGAAAIAAAAGAVTAGAGVGGAIQAAAASALGVQGSATVSLKTIGMTALKKLAIEKGSEYAVGFAAEEYAKHEQKKMTKAAENQLRAEMAAAEKEYADLLAKGATGKGALTVAATKPAGGGIIPLGLVVAAVKYAMT